MKSISIILIVSMILSSFGCYSANFMIDHDKMREIIYSSAEIYLVTKDSMEYYLEEESYIFTIDSLLGHGQRVDQVQQAFFSYSKKREPLPIRLSYNDIAYLQTEEFNELNTIIFVGTSVIVLSVLVLLGIRSSFPTYPL